MLSQLSISAVKAVDGDASIAVARGKRKNIYDFTVEFDWKACVEWFYSSILS